MKKNMVLVAMLSAALMGGAVVTAAPTAIQSVAAASQVATTTPKATLSALLSNAEGIKQGNMTTASYQGLQRAIGLAKMTMSNSASQTTDYNFATAVLRGFMDLGNTAANHFGLTYLVNSAAAVQAKDYTAASFAKFDKVYKQAIAINTQKNASQDQLDNETNALSQALEQLVYTAPSPITGSVTVHYTKGYGIQIWDGYKDGKRPVMVDKKHAKKLMAGTSWKVFQVANLDGNTWYNLGGNQWVDAAYAVYNK
ncbi:SLAP domain-containing protein [Lacticaseibacillus zhaodongensis]|uniref:SLAP domain-containing protein n=1 Tax=Lacticaseibacillus zhaodongensis TaxID=2668065 RepID=UPI0012D330BB|nr:SLAP domain-containing protein [Lacticaseibacillus zhaodongensis]